MKVQFAVVESGVEMDLVSGDAPDTGDCGGVGGSSTKRGKVFGTLA